MNLRFARKKEALDHIVSLGYELGRGIPLTEWHKTLWFSNGDSKTSKVCKLEKSGIKWEITESPRE